jgi:alkylation response protein AidB-like acyl-CoA dehydrogenase
MAEDGEFPKEFGEMVPWGDSAWYRGYNSPYYKKTHHDWRVKVRDFVEDAIVGNVKEWDENKSIPKEIYQKMYQAGLMPAVVGSPWPAEFVGDGGPEDFDAFHSLILIEELGRCGSGGVLWGLMGGMGIGLPPILHFGSDYLKQKVARKCLEGEEFICLAITEPYAGSDVANIRTTAVKDPSGDFYVVNGEKKWITNGIFADYFTVAVRTGGPGLAAFP